MSKNEEVKKLLKAYISKTQEPNISYSTFRGILDKYIDRYQNELKELYTIHKEIDVHLPGILEGLEEEGVLEVASTASGERTVRYVEYYRELVENRYRMIQARPDTPFPSEQSFPVVFPADLVIPVEAKVDFVSFLEQGPKKPARILRILFPEITKSLLVTTPLLERVLLETSLQKIRTYVRNQKNSTYLQHKLVSLFRGRERMLKDQLLTVITKPDLTLQDLSNPSDFVYQFWSQTSMFLLREVLEKKEKLEEENDLAQAAYLIGAYTIFFRGKTNKVKESESGLRYLAQQFEKSPYAYTFHDIYQLKDPKGFSLSSKIDNSALQNFFDTNTTPTDPKALPEIIKVRSIDKKEYYISKKTIAKFLIERSYPLFREIRVQIVEEWYNALQADERRKEFKDPAAFDEYATSVLKRLDPLFYSLLNFDLLFLILEQVKPIPIEKDFLETVLDRKGKKIRKISEIFKLYPDNLLREVKLKLPFWKTIPVLNHVLKFFIDLYTASPKNKKKDGGTKKRKDVKEAAITLGERVAEGPVENDGVPPERAQRVRFRAMVENLKARYAGSEADIPKDMKELIELWNTLLDPKAKANLVEDVNSLVRDFLRKLKILQRLQAPSPDRIEKLAEELAAHDALKQIRNKDALRRYILLYMIEVLSKVR